ncbi:MAG: DUF4097 family beta strand repeat protein [Pyrinomonadaceae bacterium]|nr:DUF4097 family beta strand repeat protein [Acidobacteriota bacterium]MBP7377272.1 DUF4097 family beta strand repeat protein [Pyrinomonadaceae bacterium]
MSWLYTLIFSGLIFSTNSGTGQNAPQVVPAEVPAASAPLVPAAGDETERFEQTYPLSANGRVSVSNVNGSITIEAWDRNEVQLVAVKVADSKERLAEVEIKVDAKPESISIETEYGDWKRRTNGERWGERGKLEVNYSLKVPRGAVLNEIETVNGSVTVSNFTNMTRVSAVNGMVKATNLRGTASLSTVNGEVAADFDRLDAGSKISLETVNGRVNLVIPSDSNATIRAESVNGNITNEFALPVRKGKYVGRDLYGKVGSGEIPIKLESVNGALTIGRKNDGKSLSPATDLLPQKSTDEENWDEVDAEKIASNAAKADKVIAKAMKTQVRVSEKEMERARVEMEKARVEMQRLGPELAKVMSESDFASAAIVNSKAIQDGLEKQRAAIAAYADAGYRIPKIEKRSGVFPVKGVPKITVDATGCSVKVIGTDASEVRYTVTQSVQSRSGETVQVKEEHTESSVGLKVINTDPDNSPGIFFLDRSKVRVEIYVPKKTNLKIVTNGEIRLEGVSGEIDLTGGDQSINVRDGDGSLKVGSLNGQIRVIGFRGDIDARTADGQLNLEGEFSKLTARADTGNVTLTLPDNANFDIDAPGMGVTSDGFELKRTGGDMNSKYRVGSGGKQYQIRSDGNVLIRSKSSLTSQF